MIKKLLIGIFLFPFLGLLAQTPTTLYINVTDDNNNPLDLVGVSVTNLKTGELLFNETILFSPKIIELLPGQYLITATKFGYFQENDTVELELAEFVHNIKLKSSIQNVSIGATDAKAQSMVPGIVSVIERWQIDAIGARDLMDVLETVPGLNFSEDVLMNMGLNVRGNWASEGKAIVAVNGLMVNEINYGTMQWANRFPVENIQRIEILRGPASILYGGMAAYGVINIITKTNTDMEGYKLGYTYAGNKNNTMRQNLSLMHCSKRYDNQRYLDVSAYVGRGHLTDQQFRSFSGKTYDDMFGNTNLFNEQLIVSAGLGPIRLKLMGDNYRLFNISAYGQDFSKPYPIRFPSLSADIDATVKLNQWVKFTPRAAILIQSPFRSGIPMDTSDVRIYLGDPTDAVRTHRMLSSMKFTWNPNLRYQADVMLEHFDDYIIDEVGRFYTGRNYFTYDNTSVVSTHDFSIINPKKLDKNKAWHLYGAMRYTNQEFFSAFAPQFGTYFLSNKWSGKLLYARSFKAPLAYNLIKNASNRPGQDPTVKPEFINNYEFELAYGQNSKFGFTLNGYLIETQSLIIYQPGTLDVDDYVNGGELGTAGIEFSSHMKGKMGNLMLNFSFYQTSKEDSIYQVPGKKENYAVPASKIALTYQLNLEELLGLKRTSFSGSLVQYSSKTGFAPDENFLPVLKTYPSQLFINGFLNFTNISNKGLNFSFGFYDLLNSKVIYLQPYNGGLAPTPGSRREFVTRITIDLK